jgi:nickel/cobalt transporter (NicO) family protein
VRRRVALIVDGKRAALRPSGPGTLRFLAGQGGLDVTRSELSLHAELSGARRVEVRDETFPGRVGWKAIVPLPGEGTAVRSSVPASDPTGGLRSYPENTLESPADARSATFSVRPGDGTLDAPGVSGGRVSTTEKRPEGFAGLFSDAASGEGVLILMLLAAFGWGALHALSPGHGKGMVAAYLIGTRGTAIHAIGLGATVTFTHTIGVFMLGAVTLLLSQYLLPEDLYPWLNLAAGLLVVTVGLGVLRSRLRRARHGHHHHRHGHDHDHRHAHDHDHLPDRVTWRGLVGMGVAAGLIPCPSALVVLLGAIAQHEVALGLLLILSFSIGLAATLTLLGLAVVYARRLTSRVRVPGRLATALPALSALLIVGVGFVLTAQAVPQVA